MSHEQVDKELALKGLHVSEPGRADPHHSQTDEHGSSVAAADQRTSHDPAAMLADVGPGQLLIGMAFSLPLLGPSVCSVSSGWPA